MNGIGWLIIVIVVIIILLLLTNNKEYFGATEASEKVLNQYFDGTPDQGINNFLFNKAPCSPSCCGNPYTVSYDNLDDKQLRELLAKASIDGTTGKYIANGFSCSEGNGGCPCITLGAAQFLANRGNNTYNPNSKLLDSGFFVSNVDPGSGGYGLRKIDESGNPNYVDSLLEASLPKKEEQINSMFYA